MASGDAKRILPLIAQGFADLGYRRATTAALAERCGVRENVLYRLWPSKKEMFLAAINFIWQSSMEIWQGILSKSGATGDEAAGLILEYEAKHHGETGLYKVIFAGLTEAHDAEIAGALRKMYRSFHTFIAEQVEVIRQETSKTLPAKFPTSDLTAWGLLGISMVANMDMELKLFGARERGLLFTQIAQLLIVPDTRRDSKSD
jgi:AcrR family transcriptional regulator